MMKRAGLLIITFLLTHFVGLSQSSNDWSERPIYFKALSWSTYSGTLASPDIGEEIDLDILFGTTLVVSSLNPETEYSFKIEALDAENNSSGFSACVAGTMPVPVPNIPSNVVLTVLSDSEMQISWDAVSYADSYEVYSCDGLTHYSTTTATSYPATGLIPETPYGFIIKAKNTSGTSNASSCVSGITFCSLPWMEPSINFTQSTTLIGEVKIEGAPAQEIDKVEIFVETELRSIADILKGTGDYEGRSFINAEVPGEGTEALSFVIWDQSECGELVVKSTFDSNPHNTVGSLDDLVEIFFVPNNAPTDITLSSSIIEENQASGQLVGNLSTIDLDVNDSHNYSLIIGEGSDDNAKFEINGSQLIANFTAIFNIKSSYSVRIKTDDGYSGTFEKALVIEVLDVNDAPSMNDETFAIDENSTTGTSVGTVTASDPQDHDLIFSIVSGNDLEAFHIDQNTGEITVADASHLDYETKSTYQLSVEVNDSDLSDEATITVNLNDVNETPLIDDATFAIDENSAISTSVGTVTASDPENDDLTFSIVSGNDLGTFQIDQNSGELTVADTEPLDFETNPAFGLEVEVSDGELADTTTITVNLNDVDDAVLGTLDDEGNSIKLYPNPASGFLNIEWNNFKRATISELSGKELYKSDLRTLDLRPLNAGIYLITLTGTNNEGITFRIIKE